MHELPSDAAEREKIPDMCTGLGIKGMNPYAMLRRERARSSWDSGGDTLLSQCFYKTRIPDALQACSIGLKRIAL
jgi:hypothetical protein